MRANATSPHMLELANAPVSWGVDFPDQPGIPPWQLVLDGIADAGYRNVELGPYGFLPRDAGELREALAQRGLRAAGGLLYEPFHDPAAHSAVRELASVVIRWIASAGGSYVLLIPVVSPERDAWAGRAEKAPRLDGAHQSAMAALLEELANRAGEGGLIAAVHPHAGTHLETRAEVDALLSKIEGPDLRLCVDTGHCVYGGIDPVTLVRDYSSLVAGFHLKDLARARLARSLDAGHGFEAAVEDGVFTPLGDGDVDFASLRDALLDLRLGAWATVEQDIVPGSPGDPVADAVASRSFLVDAGLAPD
jgi:inosose dehydratase